MGVEPTNTPCQLGGDTHRRTPVSFGPKRPRLECLVLLRPPARSGVTQKVERRAQYQKFRAKHLQGHSPFKFGIVNANDKRFIHNFLSEMWQSSFHRPEKQEHNYRNSRPRPAAHFFSWKKEEVSPNTYSASEFECRVPGGSARPPHGSDVG